jgi:DNA-binding response OmpR family regulator
MKALSPRILIIDDDRDNCELIELLLGYSDADYEITSVLTAEEGLRLAATRPFDLYLLDYRLIGIHGVEVCRRLRRSDAKTPIMFFTCEAQESVRQESLRAGANDYLIKPDDLARLTVTVKRLLGVPEFTDHSNVEAHNYREQFQPESVSLPVRAAH